VVGKNSHVRGPIQTLHRGFMCDDPARLVKRLYEFKLEAEAMFGMDKDHGRVVKRSSHGDIIGLVENVYPFCASDAAQFV